MSSFFGLDIGSSSIKVVQAEMSGAKGFKVNGLALIQNPVGSVAIDDPRVADKLAAAVKQVMNDAGIHDKRAVISVPESKVYSRIVEMPNMSEAELASAVSWEAEQFVPIPVTEVEIDYVVVKRPPKGSEQKMLVYLVAAPKKFLQSMVDFLLTLGIEPIAVESEMIAVSRVFTFGQAKGASLVMHIGALSTVMAVVENDALLFTHVANVGGVAMTRSISQSLQLPAAQAEEYKRTYGMDEAQLEGKVKQSLTIVWESLTSDMRKAMEHFGAKYSSNISRIVLSGGGAYMPALSTYLGGMFGGIEVLLGDPFMYARPARGINIPNERAVYSAAAGLSLREI